MRPRRFIGPISPPMCNAGHLLSRRTLVREEPCPQCAPTDRRGLNEQRRNDVCAYGHPYRRGGPAPCQTCWFATRSRTRVLSYLIRRAMREFGVDPVRLTDKELERL